MGAMERVLDVCKIFSSSLHPHPDVPEEDWEIWLDGFDSPEMKVCPKCGSPLLERQGKYGKFLGCRSYPNCKYTEEV